MNDNKLNTKLASYSVKPSGLASTLVMTAPLRQRWINHSASASLGTITKSQSTPDFKGLRENALRRSEKYALQNEAVKLLPNERVRFCLRHRNG